MRDKRSFAAFEKITRPYLMAFAPKFVKDVLKDWKIWVHMFITIRIFLPVYSVSIFLLTIIRSMGHGAELAQLMSVPSYVTACLATVIGGFAADKQRQRGVYVISSCLVA